MRSLIITALCLFLISCSKVPDSWPENAMNSELYTRDSTYIAMTHKQRLESNVSNNNSGIITKELYVDVILYSPDTLKVFAATIEEYILSSDEYEELTEDATRYAGRGLAGYRERISEPWKLYYLPMISTTTNSYEETSLSLREYFLNHIKKHELSVLLEDGTTSTIPMRYTVADTDFWNGPIWTKGIRIQDRYLFEARGSGTLQGDPFREISPFEAEYPDWLLDQF